MKKYLLLAINTIAVSTFAQNQSVTELTTDQELKQLEKIAREQQIKPVENKSFQAYQAKGKGQLSIVPIKLLVIGTDPLSVEFIKKYQTLLSDPTVNITLIGTEKNLQQFKEAYPNIKAKITLHPHDVRLDMMLDVLDIRFYPAYYDNGRVSP
ncbi:hypothetical protein [Suttonella ornithocola]|uniref:Integrating conjugative element protein, PFL_4695 family n=1 Tax=Suttonella ornithocola TaxID=279832 RepID=A0A380MWK8_9GAMM|nr:hypothetical protein [Suttonella ornithocola]SUO96652.1 Uncharacterised protein [Suttonella ornithocola]